MFRTCRLLKRFLLVASLALASTAARSSDRFEIGDSLMVEALSATPAGAGEISTIRLRLTNLGASRLQLQGIEIAAAKSVQLKANVGERAYAVLESIDVPAGDTLDLTTSHMFFQTSPLLSALGDDDVVDVTLIFNRGRTSVTAHVSAPGMIGTRKGT